VYYNPQDDSSSKGGGRQKGEPKIEVRASTPGPNGPLDARLRQTKILSPSTSDVVETKSSGDGISDPQAHVIVGRTTERVNPIASSADISSLRPRPNTPGPPRDKANSTQEQKNAVSDTSLGHIPSTSNLIGTLVRTSSPLPTDATMKGHTTLHKNQTLSSRAAKEEHISSTTIQTSKESSGREIHTQNTTLNAIDSKSTASSMGSATARHVLTTDPNTKSRRLVTTLELSDLKLTPSDIRVKSNKAGNVLHVIVAAASQTLDRRLFLPVCLDPYCIAARLDSAGRLIIEAPVMD
jgi:hypothetical protein